MRYAPWLLGLACGPLLAAWRLPDGVLRYWNCDDDDHTNWRDSLWTTGGSPRVSFDTATKREGRAALRIDGEPDAPELHVMSLNAYAEVTEEQAYVMRFWARTVGATAGAFVRVLAHHAPPDGPSRPLGWVRLSPEHPEYVLPADSDWTRHAVTVERLPGGANRLYFYLALRGPGTVWFDDFSLARAGVDVPLGGLLPLDDSDYAGIRLDDAALPDSVLTNSSFDVDPAGWGVVTHGSSIAWDSGAVRLTGVEFGGAYLYQQAPVDPRRPYRLSCRIRCADLIGYVFCQVLAFNRHGQPFGWVGADHATEFCAVTGATDGWTECSQQLQFRPETDKVAVFVRVEDTIGTAYVDDVRLTPLPRERTP